MRIWWLWLVLAACRHHLVTVAGDGGDGDGDAFIPTSVYLDQASTFGATLDVARIVPYDREVHDANGDFDPATHTFTAPRTDDYLICASLASNEIGRFELQLRTEKQGRFSERRVDFGFRVVSGCTVLRLEVAQTLQVLVIAVQDQTFQHDPLATWLTIDVVSNNAISAGATRIPVSFDTAANEAGDVPFMTPGHGTLDMGGFVSPNTGDYLVCGALESVLGRLDLSIYIKGEMEHLIGGSLTSRGATAWCPHAAWSGLRTAR